MLGLFLTACGSDRAGNNKVTDANGSVLGVVELDSDGDGISDVDEENIYGTNPDSNDTDRDGLLDGEEINIYDTNATNADTDGDGLTDGLEINTYDTNATNADTDGDCLLDGFEILNYETNASNSDTDGDKVEDGIEIYSYGLDFNSTCLSSPETLALGANPSPAIDNVPNDGTDVINALDSTNHVDTDGDGLSDRYEDYLGTNPLLADTDGDGLNDGEEISTYETNATNADTDGDGLKDAEEINTYDTNVTNADTDADGLSDGEEIHTYATNVLNSDTDGDTLLDGAEINTYDTNASNMDTDGDCLLDPHEVLHYGTNASNEDTDNDGAVDGIEIYTYTIGIYDRSCLTSPETLAGGYNENPAIDNNPDDGSDVINALDPNNDLDGDGQSNIDETKCPQGNVFEPLRICPSIEHETDGRQLEKFGYSYVPGAFDVDGDGVNEGGFWISRYQARASVNEIGSEIVIEKVGNVNEYLSSKFKVLNRNVQVLSYDEETLNETSTTAGKELLFEIEKVAAADRISSFTPYLAEVCLAEYVLKDDNGTEIDIDITMPTLKQYLQVKMLLDADLAAGGDGRHVRNGLLGNDLNVPLNDYSIIIDEFGLNRKEFVRNLIQLRNTLGTDTFSYVNDVPSWWSVDVSKSGDDETGASATQDLGHGIGPEKDPYAVIVRDGEGMHIGYGVSGALTDDSGTTNGISFRAATDYLY